MNYWVSYLTNVQYDLQDAYDYYEKESPGFGEEFLEHVDKVIEYISHYPLHFQIIAGETRKVNLMKFPYAVFYYVDSNVIRVTTVLHLHSNPEKWSLFE